MKDLAVATIRKVCNNIDLGKLFGNKSHLAYPVAVVTFAIVLINWLQTIVPWFVQPGVKLKKTMLQNRFAAQFRRVTESIILFVDQMSMQLCLAAWISRYQAISVSNPSVRLPPSNHLEFCT